MFNPEKKSSSGDKQNKRLSKDEALAYQDYATSKEGAAFSEQAKDESYTEAEMFLKELYEKGIDLGKIDFKKIDLADLLVQDEISERLSKAILEYTKGKEREGILKKINEAMNKTGIKRVVTLAVTLSILLSAAGVKSAEAGGQFMSKKDMGNENILQEKFSPEVSKVLISSLDNGKIAFGYGQSGKIMGARMDLISNLNYDRDGWESYVLGDLNIMQVLDQASFPRFKYKEVARNFSSFIQGLHARVEACEQLEQKGKTAESNFMKKQIAEDCEIWQDKIGIGFLGNNFLKWLESKKSNDARMDLRGNLNYDRAGWAHYVLGNLNVMQVLNQASFSGFESQHINIDRVARDFGSFIQGLHARVEACEQLEQKGKIAESKSMKNIIIKDCEKWEKALGIGFLGTEFFRWLNH